MFKKRLALFTLFLHSTLALAFDSDDLSLPKQLVLNDIKWPPYLFPDGEGPLGIAKDILYTCLDGEDVLLTYLDLPIKRTEFYMRSGDLDFSLYSHKASREQFVHYGQQPVFISEYGFATAARRDIKVTELSDLDGLIVGQLAGLTHTPELLSLIEQKRVAGEVVEAYDIDLQLMQLISEPPRVDIVPNSKQTFLWRAKELGISNEIAVLDYTLAFKPYYFTISKYSKNVEHPRRLLKALDDCLVTLKNNGRYEQILANYGLTPQKLITTR